MVLMKILMDIDPLLMRGSLLMMMAMISPSRREVSPAEQLRQSPRLVLPRFCLVAAESRPERLIMVFFLIERLHIAADGHRRATRKGVRPHPRGWWVAPLWYFLRSVFFIYYGNNFREVSGLLELWRIGL